MTLRSRNESQSVGQRKAIADIELTPNPRNAMTLPLILLPLFLLQTPAPMPKPVSVVAEVNKGDKAPAPTWTEIPADPILTTLVNPVAAKWIPVDDGCELRPATDGKTCVFAAAKSGRYRIVVVPENGDVMRVAVIVGKVDPVPPPAPPGPTPPPVPPVPTDPLTIKFQAAYQLDTRDVSKKKADLLDLVELCQQAAELANSDSVTSTGALVTQVAAASKALKITGLTDVRAAINAELKTAMPTDVPLTPPVRTAAAAAFAKIKTALQGVQ